MSYCNQDIPSFGQIVKLFRLKKGVNQKALAQKTKITVEQIGRIERGKTKDPQPSTIKALAKFFGIAKDPNFEKAPGCPSARIALYNNYELELEENIYLGEEHLYISSIGRLIHDVRRIIGLAVKEVADASQLSIRRITSIEQDEIANLLEEDLINLSKGFRLYQHPYNILVAEAKDEDKWGNALYEAVYNKGAYHAVQKVPSPAEDFKADICFGRQALVKQIVEMLAHESIGLYGLDGIGKTTLAKSIINEVKDSFVGGQAYVSLGSCSTEEEIQVELLSPFYHNGKDWIQKQFNVESELSRSIIHDAFEETFGTSTTNPKILIIDDVDPDHIPYLARLLNTYFQQSRALVISNKNIIKTLPLSMYPVPPISPMAAIQLLLHDNPIERDIKTQRELEELAQILTYHPLSLYIARYQIKPPRRGHMSPLRLLSIIREKILQFGDGKSGDSRLNRKYVDEKLGNSRLNQKYKEEGHQAVYRIAYENLPQKGTDTDVDAQKAFRQLCVFDESIPIIPSAALRSIWHEREDGELSDEPFYLLCDILEQSGLIQIEKQSDGIRVHALILHFSDECMSEQFETSERHLATIKHMKFYGLTSARLQEDTHSFYTATRAYREYSHRAQKNVAKNIRHLSTVDISDKNAEKVYVDFFESTAYFESINPLHAQERVIALTIVKNSEYRSVSENWALLHIGNAQMLQRNYASAKECYEEIVRNLRHRDSIPDITVCTPVHAAAYVGLANVQAHMLFSSSLLNENNFMTTVNFLKKAKYIARNLPDGEMMFYALSSLGDLYMSRFDREQGTSEPKILNRYRRNATHNYTNAFNLFRNKPTSHELREEKNSIPQTPKVFNPRLQVILYRKLGDVCAAESKFIEAVEYYQKSRELAYNIGFYQAMHDSYWREAQLCEQHDYKNRAQMLYEEAQVLKRLKLPTIDPLQ